MTATEFRHIAFGQGPRNCERVFRAAISAYCTLERPTRHEVIQLDDLTLGLFDAVSADSRRFAAAALCECDPAPPGLVHRLCDEPVEIAAPLLVRSRMLTDIDLIALIGRHGIGHAKAIARRDGLNPTIAALIRALLARAQENAPPAGEDEHRAENDTLNAVRDQLRDLMRRPEPGSEPHQAEPYAANVFPVLQKAALSGERRHFGGTLAQCLRLPPDHAESLIADDNYSDLLIAFKALDLSPEQAFFLTIIVMPAARLTHLAAIRLFLERYALLDGDAARKRVASWQTHHRPVQSVASAR